MRRNLWVAVVAFACTGFVSHWLLINRSLYAEIEKAFATAPQVNSVIGKFERATLLNSVRWKGVRASIAQRIAPLTPRMCSHVFPYWWCANPRCLLNPTTRWNQP